MNSKILIISHFILDIFNLIQLSSSSGIFHVKAISGKQISIPCQTSAWDENEVILVLWYRENSAVPFYRIDSRNRQLSTAKHILISLDLSNRYYFDVATDPPLLKINPVVVEDEGEYRCRVDYKERRTENFNTFLEVFGPPKSVKISNSFGQTLEGLIGPFDEYTYVELICEATNGNPSPTLIWYKTGVLEVIIDNSYTINSTGVVRNELTLRKLERKDYQTSLTCRASSNALYEPIDTNVVIDMNLKPLSVEILTPNVPLISGISAQYRCSSYGSRPSAIINWIINSENLNDVHNIEIDDGNGTESMMSFVPNYKHHNHYLICRASNERLANSTIEDRVLLTVEFEPQIDISIDSSHRPIEDIQEGNTVRILCKIMANPPIDSIEWAFNGKLITSPELFEDNLTLRLNNVNKHHAGKYQCTASNKVAKTTSKVLILSVKFAPICKSGQQIYYNAVRNLINRIQCSVETKPVDNTLKFKWFVNTSIELFELRAIDSLEDDLTTSIANYRPKTIMNYAMVLCLAQNSVGIQREPCIFYLRITNGPPEPVRSCEITNKSFSILSVECMSGNNGGLPQTFHLEVYSTLTEELHSNHTSIHPNFIVDSLLPETLYNLVIYATNEKGSSTGLNYHSVRLPKFEEQNKTRKDLNPLMNSFIGIVASIVICCVFIAAVIRIRAFIYEDEYKVYENYNQNKRYSEDSEDIEGTEQHNLMEENNCASTSGKTRLSSLKRLTNRLKATKCKTYEVTGIGRYTKHMENGSAKKGVTFATFDEMPPEDDIQEYNERPIDVHQENSGKDGESEDVIQSQNEEQIQSEEKPFRRKESNRRSKFFRKSFARKTL